VIFAGAVNTDASDVHIEPAENDCRLRLRIDGVLQDIANMPIESYKKLNSRIKYSAKLKMDVTTVPQDGRFQFTNNDEEIDVRVSTLPTPYGELIEMRILRYKTQLLNLEQLGFDEENVNQIKEAVTKPNGIIFCVGPTGSGKTTTLYAILSFLNKPAIKIITLEDPIEYKVPGVDQSQIDPARGYTFAKGLKAALRQDPDIIMLGEVRDAETAQIALHAALTGHLVLTTLHVNSAPAALPTLIEMGVPTYLLAGCINLIIAQRLVRKICTKCEGKKCQVCHMTGFLGRTAISEVLQPNQKIEELIAQKASLRQFNEAAKVQGMRTMMEAGMDKAQLGVTSKEEVLRVTRE
jgi:type II secretory ATPase GspE/PulE/Tfp pilus assembly ATPase PilB-like protein